MRRRSAARFVAVLAVLTALAWPCALAAAAEAKPSLILIVIDALRADHLTQFGYPLDTSSSLSLLTDRATRFEECYSPAPWTVPAVASIFSGLSPARHGVDRVGAVLGDEIQTLAETLRAAGWDTGGFSLNPHISNKANFDQGFDEFVAYRGPTKRAPDIRPMLRAATRWLDGADRPFFLYLHPMNVHGPYQVPEDSRTKLLGRAPVEGFEFFGPLMKGLMNHGKTELREQVDARFLQSLVERYDTAIRHTADELAGFFARLDAQGLWDDSLVVLAADHGEELYDHGGFAHRYSLFREVLHVPLFIKLPRQRLARVVEEPVSLVDLHPTLLELLGVKDHDQDVRATSFDGQSIAALCSAGEPRKPLDRSFVAQASNRKRCVGHAFRKGGFELIDLERSYDNRSPHAHLYDNASDPQQRTDLARRDPAMVRQMRAQLRQRLEVLRGGELPKRDYQLTPEERSRLEALGYSD